MAPRGEPDSACAFFSSFSCFYVLFCGFAFNKDIDPDCDPAHALSLIANGPGDPILEAKITPAWCATRVSNGKRQISA